MYSQQMTKFFSVRRVERTLFQINVRKVTQHVNGHKHKAAVNRLGNQPTRQILLSESFASSSSSSEQSQFVKYSTDMCNAFIFADIPFSKISSPIFRGVLQKYTHILTYQHCVSITYLRATRKRKIKLENCVRMKTFGCRLMKQVIVVEGKLLIL